MTHEQLRTAIPAWYGLLSDGARDAAVAAATRAEDDRRAGVTVYPPDDCVFRALRLTAPSDVKAVILGQDPYHGPDQANGLAFAVNLSQVPPSLRNIVLEMTSDLGGFSRYDPNLTAWARSGVLLLNSCLTVKAHAAASHAEYGWQDFTGEIIKAVAAFDRPVAFIAWGAFAANLCLEAGVDKRPDKLLIQSSHPSPFSASTATRTRPAFFGSKPFSRTNAWLEAQGVDPVDWLSITEG